MKTRGCLWVVVVIVLLMVGCLMLTSDSDRSVRHSGTKAFRGVAGESGASLGAGQPYFMLRNGGREVRCYYQVGKPPVPGSWVSVAGGVVAWDDRAGGALRPCVVVGE